MIRADPLASWEYLPEVVRPDFVRRVALVGAESVGKTTLARALKWVATAPAARLRAGERRRVPHDLAADVLLSGDRDPRLHAAWA